MKILAGIVLYEPDINRLIKNMHIIGPQVECILLINNGSADIIPFIEKKISGYCIELHIINNNENLGIAVALNQMIEYAEVNNFDWVISLDQDSIVPLDMVQEYRKIIGEEKIGIICPRICDVNNALIESPKSNIELICNEEDVITSGSCINVDSAIEVGGFDERLFIDFVDTDFQKRILLCGYKIVRNNDVVLTHEVGKIRTVNFMGHKIICTNHNAIRRYYQVRNRLYFKEKYYGKMGVIKEKVRLLLGTVKIFMFEENKKEKIVATKKGFKDYKRLLNGDNVSRLKNEKMKISFVLPALCGTGGINVVYEYANRLKKCGHDVTVYVPIKAYNMHRGKVCVDILKQIYATLKVFKAIYINKLPKKLEKENNVKIETVWKIGDYFLNNADFVIATAWCTAFDVNRLKPSKGKKFYFVQGYEIWDNIDLGRKSYQLPLKKIVIAEWIKEKLVVECGCKSEEIAVINNGINTRKFFVNLKISKKHNTIKCLMLDHSLEKKGVKYGVTAFKLAKKSIPNLKLSMFGIKKSQYVPDDVDYYENPKQDILVQLYQNSDIFIFPPLEEGWGLTAIEAMACGCAVVGTNVGCMLDIGVNNENVILCDKANSKDLAEGIIKLAQDSKFRERVAKNGYETVQKLDWEKAVEKFEVELINCSNE